MLCFELTLCPTSSNMKKLLTSSYTVLQFVLVFAAIILPFQGKSQIFLETFDEANTSTTGTENIGAVTWSTTCATCVAGDHFHVNNGELEAQDTNGPAYWETTSPIDISSCNYIEMSFDLDGQGTFEPCGDGCTATDWVSFEYNIDNTGWQSPANSYFCPGACASLNIIYDVDGAAVGFNYSTGCVAAGSSLELRIGVQCWAGSEYWRIDNILVDCTTGPSVSAGPDQTICDGSQVTLTATNPDMAVITWNNGITDGVAFTPPSGSTMYTTTATLGQCSAMDSALVTTVSGPTFTVSSTDATTCTAPFDGSITLSGLTPGQTYNLGYLNGGPVGPISVTADASGNAVVSNLAPGSYSNFTLDSAGCVGTNPVVESIASPGSPTVGAGADQSVCEGQTVVLTATNPDGAVISWDNGVTDGVAFTPPVGTTTTYTVTADLGGCVSTDIVDVVVIPQANASITPAGPFSPSSGQQNLSASPAGGTWSSNCGACIDPSTGVFDPAVAGVGNWQICYDAGTPPCDDQDCITITVTAGCALTGTISPNNPTCFGLTDGSATINMTNITGNVTFVITDSSGTVVNQGNSNTANSLGLGWYYFEVTDDFPCTYIDSVFLQDPPPMSFDVEIEDPLCFGESTGLAFIDNLINYTGALDSVSYFWTPNPTGTNGLFEDSLVNVGEGTYTVTLNDDNGCTANQTFNIVYPAELIFAPDQGLGFEPAQCRVFSYQNGNGVVYASAIGGTPAYTYLWTNVQTGQTANSSTWGGLNPGDYEVTVTDNNNCVLVGNVSLDSLSPIANFTVDSDQFLVDGLCEGTAEVTVAFTNASENYLDPLDPSSQPDFFWTLHEEDGLPWYLTHDYNQVMDTTYTIGGIYTVCLEVLNDNGCSDIMCKEMIIYDPLSFVAPNIFTPNGDGDNDEFTFNHLAKAVIEFECVIVNRWGKVVAEFTDISQSWNGQNLAGNLCPNGVYFYSYKGKAQNGEEFEGQGNIHMIGE